MNTAYIGLGANIEKPAMQLIRATSAIEDLIDTEVAACSRVYRSPPLGPQDQPDFLNACLHLRTQLQPLELLDALQAIEIEQGRVKLRRWGERCIDLDILLFNTLTLNHPRLTLPHPGLGQRRFVLQPLSDLLPPDHNIPGLGQLGPLAAQVEGPLLTPTALALKADKTLETTP